MRPLTAVSMALTAALGALPVVYAWVEQVPGAEREAQRLNDEPAGRAAALAGRLAGSATAALSRLASREGERPWFHWQHFMADPRGVYDGEALVPSPLAAGPGDPLVLVHLQIDERGRLSTPEVFEGSESPRPEALARRALLDTALEPVAGELGLVPADVARVESTGGDGLEEVQRPLEPSEQLDQVQQVQRPVQQFKPARPPNIGKNSNAKNLGNQEEWVQVQQLDNAFYQQNVNVADVYQQIKGKKVRPGAATGEVVLRIGGFSWWPIDISGKPALLALRVVETPDGVRRQGFIVTRDALEAELKKVAPSASLGAVALFDPPEVAVPIALPTAAIIERGWRVRIPMDQSEASIRAAGIVDEARLTAWLTTFAALLVAGLVIAVLVQSERLLERRQRFAAAAAHELRTPLAGLRMYAEMLAHGLGRPEKQRLYAERLVSESARLGRVVSNVLDFTRLEKRKLELDPKGADVVPFVRELAMNLAPTLAAAGATLEVEAPTLADPGPPPGHPGSREVPLVACFDPDALTQILVNLIDNAEKYTRDAADRTITVSVRRGVGQVEIAVRDRGPGLPGKGSRVSRLFAPFSRGVGHDGPAGLGLGLALGRALAKAQGGTLEPREVSQGAELVVTLPLASGPTAAPT